MHIRLIFRNHLQLKQRDTLEVLNPGAGNPGRKGPKISREVSIDRGEKSFVYVMQVPVPETDTGGQEENSKASGRRVVKELGKLTP